MDNFEVIIYIVISIIWFIVQSARKKKNKKGAAPKTAVPQQRADRGRSSSPQQKSIMDEILQEIREEREKEKASERTRSYEPEPVKSYEDNLDNNKSSVYYDRMLQDWEKERGIKVEGRFEDYKIGQEEDEEEEYENDYANLIFEDPDSARNAIVLSEILNRKHF